MQVGCQLDTIEEKVAHPQKNMITRSTFDVECINYADDEVETYKDEVTRCLYDKVKCGNGSYAGTRRLVNIESVTESVNQLACGQCAKKTVTEAEEETMKQFKQFVANDGVNTATMDLIDRFTKSRVTNKLRRGYIAEKKSKVHVTEDVMGISSEMYIQCNSTPGHWYPMTFTKDKKKKKGQNKNIDRDENKIAIMLPFVTGVGPEEMETILNMFSLPNSKHY